MPVQLCIPMKNETVGMDFSFCLLRSELLHTCTLICSLSDKHGVLILCSPIDMVNKVSSIMGVINPFPAKRKFVIWAFFGSFLLYPRQSRIQPMTCTGIMVCKKDRKCKKYVGGCCKLSIDIYVPKCWVDLSFNSRVIFDFFLFWKWEFLDQIKNNSLSKPIR